MKCSAAQSEILVAVIFLGLVSGAVIAQNATNTTNFTGDILANLSEGDLENITPIQKDILTTATIEVFARSAIELPLEKTTFFENETLEFYTSVYLDNGSMILGAELEFYLDYNLIGSNYTNNSGLCTFRHKLTGLKKGKHSLSVVFPGQEFIHSSEESVKISVINTPPGRINLSRANYRKFDTAETTKFNEAPDIANVCKPVLAKKGVARIEWLGCVNASGADFDSFINIPHNFVSVDSSNLDITFNNPANITIHNLDYDFIPIILRDGAVCPDVICTVNFYSSGTFSFNVTHFSNYSTGANANLSIWDETDAEGGSQTFYVNQNVTFFANYTNFTSGDSINGSGVYCNITFNDTSDYWNMTFNSSSLYYEFNRTFSSDGMSRWDVICNGSSEGYEELNTTDTVLITQDTGYPSTFIEYPSNNTIHTTNSTTDFIFNATDEIA
jgi:hypothetical protein